MSELGSQTFGRPNNLKYLDIGGVTERNYSEETAKQIDAAVHELIETERKHAYRILEERREQLQTIADRLLEQETLNSTELRELAGLPPEEEARA